MPKITQLNPSTTLTVWDEKTAQIEIGIRNTHVFGADKREGRWTVNTLISLPSSPTRNDIIKLSASLAVVAEHLHSIGSLPEGSK